MSRDDKSFFHNTEKNLVSGKMLGQLKVVIFSERLSILTFMEGTNAEEQGLSFYMRDGNIYADEKELIMGKIPLKIRLFLLLKKKETYLSVTFLLQTKILLFQKIKKQISSFARKLIFCFPTERFISIQMTVYVI